LGRRRLQLSSFPVKSTLPRPCISTIVCYATTTGAQAPVLPIHFRNSTFLLATSNTWTTVPIHLCFCLALREFFFGAREGALDAGRVHGQGKTVPDAAGELDGPKRAVAVLFFPDEGHHGIIELVASAGAALGRKQPGQAGSFEGCLCVIDRQT
jgi:hypothetical protein